MDGRTRLAGVIGWPLEHTLSPAMHNAAYEAMGLDWVYVPLAVSGEEGLARVVSAARVLPFVGFNVTMPYKETILGMCDEVTMLAQMTGAVNTVVCREGRLIGYNTDSRGLVESLEEDAGFSVSGSSVVLLGAGGAAGAALVGFILGNARRVTVLNRTIERAQRLVERVESRRRDVEVVADVMTGEDAQDAVRSADLVVNATSVGMEVSDPSPVPVAWLSSQQVVLDMVYQPSTTALLRGAEAAGARAIGGLGMLVRQGAVAIETWNEGSQTPAPRDVMFDAARAAVAETADLLDELGI